MNRPRVLLADDHRVVAEALKGVLADEFEVVRVCAWPDDDLDSSKRPGRNT